MGTLNKINHIVVLMLENRSFDHILGYLYGPGREGYDGVSGKEANPDSSASPPLAVPINDGAQYAGDLAVDPCHDAPAVTFQLFRNASPTGTATNDGFVDDYARQPGNTPLKAHAIMNCFHPDRLPGVATLAKSFAVCDHWYASVPGPTWPNRVFTHAASSKGFLDNKLHPYDMDTVYDRLEAKGVSWAIYFQDIPQALALTHLRGSALKGNLHWYQTFLRNAAEGSLPGYSFIEPQYFNFGATAANDCHPPHDVRYGHELIAKTYEALRNGPGWEQTLFLVLFDEHGGIYDHELPTAATPPDKTSDPIFSRYGVRVPAIVISPYTGAGFVDQATYDHTSISATLRERFGIKSLTGRDTNAASFGKLISLDQPRSDAPTTLPRLIPPTIAAIHELASGKLLTAQAVSASVAAGGTPNEPLSEYQRSLVDLAHDLPIPGETEHLQSLRMAMAPTTEHNASAHVQDTVARFLDRVD